MSNPAVNAGQGQLNEAALSALLQRKAARNKSDQSAVEEAAKHLRATSCKLRCKAHTCFTRVLHSVTMTGSAPMA